MNRGTTYAVRAAILLLLITLGACSQRTSHQGQINRAIYNGNIQGAYDILAKNPEKWMRGRNQLLYFWERGTIAWMLGDHEESKDLFMTSDYYLEDLYGNYANEALALFSNDKVKIYKGEDHEKILFQYYQILNFMNLGEVENALVQVRRLQLELNRLDDRYKDKKDALIQYYQRDAFAYVLMGLVFEAANEKNNAFIAYKKAISIYESDYEKFFRFSTPQQLKEDFLRVCYDLGFSSDLKHWEEKWKMSFDPKTMKEGNFVYFWMNGLAPIKEEVSINFTIDHSTGGGWATFNNTHYGLSIPVYVGTNHTQKESAFSQLEFIRVAIPKYVSRGAFYTQATLISNGQAQNLELIEDVGAISMKIQSEHFLFDLGKTLARLAIKKASEAQLRKENENAGAAIGVLNLITEQADTRGWESLPNRIHYSRMSLRPGKQVIEMRLSGNGAQDTYSTEYKIPSRGYSFQGFHTFWPAKTGISR